MLSQRTIRRVCNDMPVMDGGGLLEGVCWLDAIRQPLCIELLSNGSAFAFSHPSFYGN